MPFTRYHCKLVAVLIRDNPYSLKTFQCNTIEGTIHNRLSPENGTESTVFLGPELEKSCFAEKSHAEDGEAKRTEELVHLKQNRIENTKMYENRTKKMSAIRIRNQWKILEHSHRHNCVLAMTCLCCVCCGKPQGKHHTKSNTESKQCILSCGVFDFDYST